MQLKVVAELRTKVIVSLAQAGVQFDSQTSRSLNILTRHLRIFGKFFRRLQQLSPARFVVLPMSSDLILFYWSQIVDATNGPADSISGFSRVDCH